MQKATLMMLGVTMLLLFSRSNAVAGDTFSYGVSCTIPAIPGVNVPLVEETVIIASEDMSRNFIQKSSEDAAGGIVVKTFYEK